jgi:hypothetical protein
VQLQIMQVQEALCFALINTCKPSQEQALTINNTSRVQEVIKSTRHAPTALLNGWGKSEVGEAFR